LTGISAVLDKIHLFVPFRADAIATSTGKRGNELLMVDLEALGVPLRATSVLSDGKGGYQVEDISHAWESLSTGFTPLAFKVFHQSLGKRIQPGVELKASPAKLLQGHNVFPWSPNKPWFRSRHHGCGSGRC